MGADSRRRDDADARLSSSSVRGNLPHLYKPGCTYFVTFCLQDAVPQKRLHRLELQQHDDPIDLARCNEPKEQIGKCILRRPRIGQLVEDSLLYFQNERYALFAWVVMPNHAHVVMAPFADYSLSMVLHSWKSYTASQIKKTLRCSGSVWQTESFDHLIRSEESFSRFVEYTEANPVVAGLCLKADDWPWSSARYRAHFTDSGAERYRY